jgi:hypothetical protein
MYDRNKHLHRVDDTTILDRRHICHNGVNNCSIFTPANTTIVHLAGSDEAFQVVVGAWEANYIVNLFFASVSLLLAILFNLYAEINRNSTKKSSKGWRY